MGTSQNGWPLSRRIVSRRVPGTHRNLSLNREAAPLLLYVARRFDTEVAAIDTGVFDDWGYARPRPIPGSSIYSNHGSGTAIDLNATRYPWGGDRMKAADKATCRRIVKACGGTIRWGGDYKSKLDQMHWEIDASPAAVRAQIKRMRLRANGTVKPPPRAQRPVINPARLVLGAHNAAVMAWQQRLKALGYNVGPVDGVFGPATKAATRKFQKAHHRPLMNTHVGPFTVRAAGFRTSRKG